MALFERIATSARVQLVRAGGMELLAAFDMAAFLEEAKRMRVGILGIEAFRIRAGAVIPDPSVIADYSTVAADPAFVDRSIGEVRGFLALTGREQHYYKIKILGRNPLAD